MDRQSDRQMDGRTKWSLFGTLLCWRQKSVKKFLSFWPLVPEKRASDLHPRYLTFPPCFTILPPFRPAVPERGASDLHPRYSYVTPMFNYLVSFQACGSWERCGWSPSCLLSGLRFLRVVRLISILSPFRPAVPESGAPDLHPGHSDMIIFSPFRPAVPERGASDLHPRYSYVTPMFNYLVSFQACGSWERCGWSPSCLLSGLRFLRAVRLISILSPFRSAVSESGAADLHPRYSDVPECPEDEHDDPPDTAGCPLHQSVAGFRWIPTSGMLYMQRSNLTFLSH